MELFTGGSRRSRGPIGVDLGAHSVRLLQFTDEGAHPKVIAAAERSLAGVRPIDGPAYHQVVGEALRALLGAGRFRGRRVVSALPASVVHFKNMRLPMMPADEMTQAVEWEARERGQFGSQAAEVRYFNVGEVRQGEELRQEVILMAAPTAFTEAHVQTLLDCGLDPVALDVTPAALQRCVDATVDNAESAARIVLDVGYAGSKALIVRQGRVLFFKLIEIGGRKFDEVVAQRLDISLPEAAEARRACAPGLAAFVTPAHGEASSASPQATESELTGEEGQALAMLRAQSDAFPIPSASPVDTPTNAPIAPAGHRSEAEVARAVYEAVRPAIAELAREVSLCLRYYSVTFRSERPAQLHLAGGEAATSALGPLLAEGTGMAVTAMDPFAQVDVGSWSSVIDAGAGRVAWATAAGMARRREVSMAQGRAA